MSGITCILFLVLLFALSLRKKENISVLDKDDMRGARGLFAVAIILHHVSQIFDSNIANAGISFFFFSYTGIFYMLSGYGLSFSVNEKTGYLQGFIYTKIFKLFLPYIVALMTEIIASVFLKNKSVTLIIRDSGWFVKSIIIMYLIWFVCYKFYSHRGKEIFYLSMLLGVFLYVTICYVMRLESFWFSDIFSFFLGIMIYYNQSFLLNNVESKNDKVYIIILLIILLACWLYVFVLGGIVNVKGLGLVTLVIGGGSLIMFLVFVYETFQNFC